MAHQSTIPEGNAFVVNLPKFDQARQQLYQEQQQRRAYQQREADQVNQQIGRQFSRIRSVDAPDIIGTYNQAKDLKKQLLFDPKVQNNPQLYNDIQQKYNEALGTVFQKADQSAQWSQMGKDLSTSYLAHPDRYADNFGDLMKNLQNTPMDKLQNHPMGDLSNPDTYMYKGSNTDFGKLQKAAMGTPRVVYSESQPADEKNLQTKITPYSYGNTPAQYYQTMLGALQQRGAGRDASAAWDHMVSQTPGLIEHVNQEYEKITPEAWKRMTGSDKPQIINPDPTNSADQFAAFQAKAYALNNLPKAGDIKTVNNQANLLEVKNAQSEKMQNLRFRQQKLMEGIRQNDREASIGLHRLYAKQDAESQNALVDEHFKDEFDKAKEKAPVSIPTAAGTPVVGFEVSPIDIIAKQFTAKSGAHNVTPDRFVLSPDGKTMTGIFLTQGKDGKVVVDDSKSKTMDVDLNLKPVFRNFVAPKSKVVAQKVEVPKIPVNAHKGMLN